MPLYWGKYLKNELLPNSRRAIRVRSGELKITALNKRNPWMRQPVKIDVILLRRPFRFSCDFFVNCSVFNYLSRIFSTKIYALLTIRKFTLIISPNTCIKIYVEKGEDTVKIIFGTTRANSDIFYCNVGMNCYKNKNNEIIIIWYKYWQKSFLI